MKYRTALSATLITAAIFLLAACNNEQKPPDAEKLTKDTEVHGTQIKPGDVQVTTPLNQEWVTAGKSTYDLKCQGCHKLTDERVVGPGWSGVTKRRQPEWIMNMVTNVDMMLETDPEAQKLLEQCLVRMPNQNLSLDESRKVLEFMRSNDGVK
jgi:hypothetical protein